MKASKIYKISITSEIDEDNDDFNHPIYEDFTKILDLDENKYIGFADSKTIFTRLLDYKFKLFCGILSKYGIEFDIEDVTSSVIKGDIQKQYPDVEKLTPHIFEDFRYDNTSIDDVLDKINEKGINSIDDIDKNILKNPS